MIHISEVFNIINLVDEHGRPVPFSIRYVQADVKRKTGGKEAFYPSVVKNQSRKGAAAGQQPSQRTPNHVENLTFNIRLFPSQEIKTVHTPLILELNGQKVRYKL